MNILEVSVGKRMVSARGSLGRWKEALSSFSHDPPRALFSLSFTFFLSLEASARQRGAVR